MTPNEYAARKEAVEQDLDRQVEAWRQAPALPTIAKTAGWMAGLLTTGAVVGFVTSGPIGAVVAPVLITLPAICFSGLAAGLSDTEESVREDHRAKAYAAAGIANVRDLSHGPSVFNRLAQIIGRRAADTVAKKATADIARAIWGTDPTDVRYLVADGRAHPMASNVHEHGEVTKITIKADGEVLVTHAVGGKLQSTGGRPSSAKLGTDAQVIAAAWHDEGVVAQTWRAGQDVPMTIDVQVLVAECHALADEIRCFGDQDAFADALDELGVRAAELAGHGYTTLPLSLDADGKVNMAALDEYVKAATNTAAPRR